MLVFTGGKGALPTVDHTEHCCLCGQCVAICQSDAITHEALSGPAFERITDRRPVDPEAFLQAVKQRRSVRNYKDQPVPKALLEKVVSVAGFAPGAAHNGVGWERHVTVVTGKENMAQVRDHTVEYMRRMRDLLDGFLLRTVEHFSEQAHAVRRTVLPDTIIRLVEWFEQDNDRIIYEAPAAVFVHAPEHCTTPQEDCDAALMAILLVADAFGLGCCWNGWLYMAADGDHQRGFTDLKDFLGIPKDHVCRAAATVGYPSLRLHSVPDRRTNISWVE